MLINEGHFAAADMHVSYKHSNLNIQPHTVGLNVSCLGNIVQRYSEAVQRVFLTTGWSVVTEAQGGRAGRSCS